MMRLLIALIKIPIALLYFFLITVHPLLYRFGIIRKKTAKNYIISVGNLTFGGSGKTPMVSYLLTLFKQHDITACVLTRGYKSQKTAQVKLLNQKTIQNKKRNWHYFGDEACMLFNQHNHASFYIHPNRAKSAQLAENQFAISLLDDAMQHYSLKKNLEITLLDLSLAAEQYRLFPFGNLRVPLSRIKKSDIIIFTKKTNTSAEVEKKLQKYLHNKLCFYCEYTASHLLDHQNEKVDLDFLKNKEIILLSAIANPSFFRALITPLSKRICDEKIFADHHHYNSNDIELINQMKKKNHNAIVVTTEKDWVKLKEFQSILTFSIYQLAITMVLPKKFDQLILQRSLNDAK